MIAADDQRHIIDVRGLRKHYPIRRGILRREVGAIHAVDDVSLGVRRGETLGLVGESGSGKSTMGRVILALDKPTAGRVLFDGKDLATMKPREMQRIRQQIQFIFQDPFASLNPRMRIGNAIREPLDIHNLGSKAYRKARVRELLEMVGLDASYAARFPHEFSGGQRQRIGIARALATEPSFIVADEPISALDVSIQAQIVNLLDDLKAKLGLTYLFIAHDLSMVRHISDRVAVMYLGRLVETGPCDEVFQSPGHPYTRALLSAMPVASPDRVGHRLTAGLQGEIPNPANPPPGCHFHTRCPFATGICRRERPMLRNIESKAAAREVACHNAENIRYESDGVRSDS